MSERLLSNQEIVTLAVYLLGGERKAVDTEDVAYKANELAPGRFTWRKYKDQISLDAVYKRLWEATREEKGSLLVGSEKTGWHLTEAGLDFARKATKDLPTMDLARERLTPREHRWRSAERVRLLASEAFMKYQEMGSAEVTDSEVQAFFRIDPYVTGAARDRKILRIVNTFGDDPELGPAVRALARRVEER